MNTDHRLKQIEAELAVRNVIARYGLAADCGDIDIALACHTEDALYIVSNPRAGREAGATTLAPEDNNDLELFGHQAIADMLRSEMHQSLLPHCAHTVGPLNIEIELENDRAFVTGYSRVYQAQKLMRLAINHWTIKFQDGVWKIARRESRVIGEPKALTLLKHSLNRD